MQCRLLQIKWYIQSLCLFVRREFRELNILTSVLESWKLDFTVFCSNTELVYVLHFLDIEKLQVQLLSVATKAHCETCCRIREIDHKRKCTIN